MGEYNKMYRGAKEESKENLNDLTEHPSNKNLKDYDPIFENCSVFFSTYNPDIIEQALMN